MTRPFLNLFDCNQFFGLLVAAYFQEEEAWKVRRAKQQAKAKAKAKELKAAKGGQQQQNGAAMSAAPTPADNGIDDNDPDTAHWGEFLEDAKKEAEREGSGEGVEAGEEGADPAAAAAAAALAAQRKAKKKSGKKKRGASWNKKANNLWVYVKGEVPCRKRRTVTSRLRTQYALVSHGSWKSLFLHTPTPRRERTSKIRMRLGLKMICLGDPPVVQDDTLCRIDCCHHTTLGS